MQGSIAGEIESGPALTAKNGLPCEAVQDMVNDEGGGLWLHLACGFVHISTRDVDAWSRDTTIRLDLKLYDALDGARAGRGTFEPATCQNSQRPALVCGWFGTPDDRPAEPGS